MSTEHVLRRISAHISRLRDIIKRAAPVTSMKEGEKIAANAENKGNSALMCSILVPAKNGSPTTMSGFSQMSRLVFGISFIVKMMAV